MEMRRQLGRRIFSLLMAVVMVLGTMPMPVFAAEEVHAYSDEEAVTVSGWPTIRTDLTHIICYGQSFSTGSDAPYYEDPAVNGVYVYGNITNSTNGTELAGLSSSAGNQHPIISAGNVLAKLLFGAGYDTDIILGSYGSGGKTIAQLMSADRQQEIKGEEGYTYDILSSGRYEVFQSSVPALAQYAQSRAQSISCPAIVYLQGETDQNTDAQLGYPDNPARAGYGAGGDKEKYKEYMSRLKEDMQREIMEQYGQTEKPLFLIYQVSGTYTRTDYSSINMAQLEFALENEDVILVQTPYFTSHYTNSHHLTQNGYRWLGEYIGRSIYTALAEQKKTWPLLPASFAVEGENTIRISISGVQNGLSIDTYTVEDASDSRNLYGFCLEVDGARIKPTNVTASGNEIVVTLSKSIDLRAAEKVYVIYAGRRAQGTGNIRDNCTELGFYEYLDDSNDTGTGNNQGVSHSALDVNGNSLIGQKYPLYNWLAAFCYEIEVPKAEPRQGAYYHWEMQKTGLVSITEGSAVENKLTLLQGSVNDGVLQKVQYSMDKAIVLNHDRPWVIEWKSAGNGKSFGGGKLLSISKGNGAEVQYLYLPADSRGFVAWGVPGESSNYGFKLSALGIDTREEHIYRIENRISTNGDNAIYLMVDGVEIGAMDTAYSTKDASQVEQRNDWANGKDIYLDCIGEATNFLLSNMKLSYLKVWENDPVHIHAHVAEVTAPTCTERGYTTYTCECGESYVGDYVEATGHSYKNGICDVCGSHELIVPPSDTDLFVFAGQSNMMGASVLEPEVNTFTDKAWEYKHMPKLRGAETGAFTSAQNPAGEWHYIDLETVYGDHLYDLTYKAKVKDYSSNTYFCPAMRDGVKGFSGQSEADTYPAASLAPYFVTEYAKYGHSSIYAHMAKGSVKIVHYFTEEMMNRYNTLVLEYNAQNNKVYDTLTLADLSGAGDAFDNKYNAMLEDYATITPDGTIKNKCFVWLQGEGDSGRSYIEYKLKMQVLWEHLRDLGFTHFFVLRVGYWGNTGILNVMKAQEDFCAENENCYIVTRAPSLIPHPSATIENWWVSEPPEEYDNCRDSYLVASNNHHFNEKAMQIFAERSAQNAHRILYQGLDPILEEENIRGMQPKQDENPDTHLPEDTIPYTSYKGTESFCNGVSVSQKSNVWKEAISASAASTNLIPVTSADSVWIQYVFFLSEAHAVGGFYDKEGNLVAPLYYKDFGFSLGGSGGEAAFRTPETTNRISISAIEAVTGKEIAFVRFTAWRASAGGHADTEARIYHTYTSIVTAPTCTEQGYTTYTCECGESYVGDYVEATGHAEVVDAAVAPTCTAAGLTEGKHCSVCGEVLAKQETIPALGHSYELGKCTVCGAADPDFRVAVEAVGEIDYTVSGSTVTVTHDTACKVGYLMNDAYVKIDATPNPDGSYSFTAPEGVTDVLVVISGDVNGNGSIQAADKSRLNAALLKKTTLSAKEIFAAHVNDDGQLLAADKSRLNAVLLKKTTLMW